MADPTRNSPVLIELDDIPGDAPGPATAPPVPDPLMDDRAPPTGRAMQTAAVLASRRPSRLARWFWALLSALIGVAVSTAAWNTVTGLVAANPFLGWAVAGLLGLFLLVAAAIITREVSAFARLSRMDRLHTEAEAAAALGDLARARGFGDRLVTLYQGRADLTWHLQRFEDRRAEQFDAPALLDLAERTLLSPLDAAALREVEAATRQVATVTALVPLALADLAAALTSNIRMIRRIAEIYGGRSGTLGSLRLTRAVMTHLVATGAVAVSDDMVGSILGGNLLARLSRRFGEGIVNGALTARVGVAAMEVCRPMPFAEATRPRVTGIIRRSLTGLFDREDKTPTPAPDEA
ncbi:YcjF family protein [Pseudooceanicola aestuarii]|uniref:YcjF family protein n=1 Tax=Pseudooceanicola aestuarii TaxID=2697319 RepID=UPI0013CFBDB4|nr:TIGR01620 family protein [Pseudooceanicola aestuarii]